MNATKPVAPLDKVHLHLRAVPDQGNPSSAAVDVDTDFIYGIGNDGISPFEKMLHAKCVGDQFSLPVAPGVDDLIFGHLHRALAQRIQIAPPYVLHVTVTSVSPAAPSEVVRAMAKSTGCGGGCGCGCGGH